MITWCVLHAGCHVLARPQAGGTARSLLVTANQCGIQESCDGAWYTNGLYYCLELGGLANSPLSFLYILCPWGARANSLSRLSVHNRDRPKCLASSRMSYCHVMSTTSAKLCVSVFGSLQAAQIYILHILSRAEHHMALCISHHNKLLV